VAAAAGGAPRERLERFDRDPGWEGRNNRSATPEPRRIRQDFGHSRAARPGGDGGEVGGYVTPAGEPAYYAARTPERTFRGPFKASGRLQFTGGHVLIAFFNAATVNEWRPPNCVALRLLGRGGYFYAYVEYATSKWRAGGDSPQGFAAPDASGRPQPLEFPEGRWLDWSLEYDPAANGGGGAVLASLGGRQAVCHLDAGHQADGARMNRFGLLNVVKSADGGGEVWLDDVTLDGRTHDFARDPRWEARGNRREYVSRQVRPRFDFGWSPTRHAGGAAAGELGGTVFRGDGRYPDKMAYYGDRVGPYGFDTPLHLSGRLTLRRGVSDSTTLLGFFDSRVTTEIGPSQATGFPDHFLGVAIEGPSAEGFFLYPVYRGRGEGGEGSRLPNPNRILPDGSRHRFRLDYDPGGAAGAGEMAVSLDDNTVRLPLTPVARRTGARFDRLGLVTTRVDGNAQEVFFDDLRYTAR